MSCSVMRSPLASPVMGQRDTSASTIEEIVGERIRMARGVAGISQEQLGQGLEPYLGRQWSRQAVSTAEKGGRDFTALELLALAEVLDVHTAWLMTPPGGATINTPGGTALPADDLWRRFQTPKDGVGSGILMHTRRLLEHAQAMEDQIEQMADWARVAYGMKEEPR